MGNKTIIYTEKRNKFFSGDNANFDFNFDSEVKTDREAYKFRRSNRFTLRLYGWQPVPVQVSLYFNLRRAKTENHLCLKAALKIMLGWL
jgi:hypothetical protein